MALAYRKILFATDLSDLSFEAWPHAETLAEKLGAEITAVSVLEETYCAIACATKASFATPDALSDARLRSHAARESVVSYAGVPIRDVSGCVVATLCHFDVRPRLIPPNEISVLELVAPVVEDWLQTGRYRT
jgi:GAF domain-containing protein